MQKIMKKFFVGIIFCTLLIISAFGSALLPHSFTSNFSSGQPASVVLGQSNFTSANRGTTPTDSDLSNPNGLAIDPHGNVWIVDNGNNRVLEFSKGAGFTNGEVASVVIGQPNFTSSTNERTQTGLDSPWGIAFDSSGDLWVSDFFNNRVLEFVPGTSPCAAGQFCNGMPASVVIGQKNFTVNSLQVGQSTLPSPTGITFDSHGDLWVAEQNVNRIVEFVPGSFGCPTDQFCTSMNASLVIGQSNFTTDTSAVPPKASSLDWPEGLAFDSSGDLWVSDSVNNRVLEYIPGTSGCPTNQFCDGMSASTVIGQDGFITSTNTYPPNNLTLSNPFDVSFDSSGNLWIADQNNHRVLEYIPGTSGCPSEQFCSGMGASLVIGQSGFTTDFPQTTASGLYDPFGIAFDQAGNLWVSDYDNFRVLEFIGSATTTTLTSQTSSTSSATTSSTSSSLNTSNSTSSSTSSASISSSTSTSLSSSSSPTGSTSSSTTTAITASTSSISSISSYSSTSSSTLSSSTTTPVTSSSRSASSSTISSSSSITSSSSSNNIGTSASESTSTSNSQTSSSGSPLYLFFAIIGVVVVVVVLGSVLALSRNRSGGRRPV